MYMKVEHGLSRAGADVKNGEIAVFDVAIAANLRGDEMAAADDFCVGLLRFFQAAQVVFHAHSNPPVSGGRIEREHFGGLIAAREMSRQVTRVRFMPEASDLHCPFASGFDWCRRLQDLNPYLTSTFLDKADLFCGCLRKIHDAALDERAAIGDSDDGGISVLDVDDAHD